MDRSLGARGHVRLVRHHDDRAALAVEILEQVKYFTRRRRVQVASRLIGQDKLRVIDKTAGDGHALLLAAGKLRRPVVEPLRQADHFRQLQAPFPSLAIDAVAIIQRHLNVFHD